MIDEDVIQYHVPGKTEISFVFEPQQKNFHLNLINGTARIYLGNKHIDILKGNSFILSLWNCLTPRLETVTESEFEIYGNHYIYQAFTKIGRTLRLFFTVSQQGNGFTFVLDAAFQLQIFVSASKNSVRFAAIRGTPEVLGRSLALNHKYRLGAGSSILVNSRDGNPYTVAIYGRKRRVEISLLEKDILKHMKNVQVRIRSLRQLAVENCCQVGPVILVMGPEYVGKTSVCNFLLNKALEDKMQPVYIDLDVCRNTSTVPGTITLRKIVGEDINCPTAFEYNEQSILQFGSTNFNAVNIQLYHHLVRKISNLLHESQLRNHKTRHAGVIIDMCGTLGKDAETIKCIQRLFIIELVVIVGDESYYDFVKNVILEGTKIEFVPQPRSIKMQHKNWATKAYMTVVLKYFYGESVLSSKAFHAKFSDFKVYKYDDDNLMRIPNNHCTNNTEVSFSNRLIKCDPSIEKYILGVVRSDRTNEVPVAEIDYFLCFACVNVEEKYVTVLSPKTKFFRGKILILSNIRLSLVENGVP